MGDKALVKTSGQLRKDFDPNAAEKQCSSCKEIFPKSAFSKANKKRSGVQSYCKVCTLARGREEKLKYNYGLTLADYDNKFAAQNNGCAICFGTNASGVRLSVDHNHATGQVRGLLCYNCNVALGRLQDDVNLIRRAAAYLEEYNG